MRLAFLAGEAGVEPRLLPFRDERGESSSLSSDRLEPRLNRPPPPRDDSGVSLLPLSAVPPRVERPPKSPRAMPSGDRGEDLPESGVPDDLRDDLREREALLLPRLFEFPRPLVGGDGLLVPPNLLLEFPLDLPPPLLEARLPSLSSSSDSSRRLGARPFALNRRPFWIDVPVAPLAAPPPPPPLLSLVPAESADPDLAGDLDRDRLLPPLPPARLLGESELESLCLCLARPRLRGEGVLDFCVLILGSVFLPEGPRSKVGILTGPLLLGGALVSSGPSPQELLSSLSLSACCRGIGCCC